MAARKNVKAAPAISVKEFFSIAELAAANLPGMPCDVSALDKIARTTWRGDERLARRVPGKTKPIWEYHYSLLPQAAQTRLLVVHMAPANDDRNLQRERKAKLWHGFETLSKDQKTLCEARLKALQTADDLELGGMTASAAVTMACARAGVTKSAFYEWRKLVAGLPREDWLAALAPSYTTDSRFAECHAEVWDILKSDYTGNKPDAKPENYGKYAVPLATFIAHVDEQMAEHNARVGRKGGNCNGRSFDETFEQSLADPGTIVRTATAAQRSLWLLASEAFKARKPNGEIHLHGNRYWAPPLTGYVGKKVIVRFDPDQLHRDIKIYDLDNSLICDAPCIEDAGFHDTEAARTHAKLRGDYARAICGRMRLDMVAISKLKTFGFGTNAARIVLNMDNYNPAKHTAVPKIVLENGTVVTASAIVPEPDFTKPSRTKITADFVLPAGTTQARARVDATTTQVIDVPFGQDIQLIAY